MKTAYYNELDPYAAAWLRNLKDSARLTIEFSRAARRRLE